MVSIIETESRQKQEIGYVGGSQDQGAKSRGLGGGMTLHQPGYAYCQRSDT